jgi:hypothetical protein
VSVSPSQDLLGIRGSVTSWLKRARAPAISGATLSRPAATAITTGIFLRVANSTAISRS